MFLLLPSFQWAPGPLRVASPAEMAVLGQQDRARGRKQEWRVYVKGVWVCVALFSAGLDVFRIKWGGDEYKDIPGLVWGTQGVEMRRGSSLPPAASRSGLRVG